MDKEQLQQIKNPRDFCNYIFNPQSSILALEVIELVFRNRKDKDKRDWTFY